MSFKIHYVAMKFVDEYRDKKLIAKIADLIRKSAVNTYSFMEVCGGHTAAIHRFGIPSMLPQGIRLLTGPGCPVCVTGTGFIDNIISLSRVENIIISTFGDMLRIPGSDSSLEKEKQKGADIRMVFSGLEALEVARRHPDKKVVFPGIGFETTAPGTAATILEARKSAIRNFYILSAHKLMPPAMEAICRSGTEINGFICPGHVAAVTGSSYFSFISGRHGIGCVITGFEPADILQSIYMLVQQVNLNKPETEIQYKRAVTAEGNSIALQTMNEVFEPADANWRGLGTIPHSGMKLRDKYGDYDAFRLLNNPSGDREDNSLCICGEILRGTKRPSDCSLFADACTPENPVGACMVSNEGSCNTYYKYKR
jgi:hydrogenase expression/formation protein HypD